MVMISVDVEGVPLRNGGVDYSTIVNGVPLLLDLFKESNVKATFYVTSDAAETTTDILREVIECGHEIGCHGYEHENLREATLKISDNLDVMPIGFRAHHNQINERILESLIKVGYKYDSSVVPSSRVLNRNYFPSAPQKPYHPSLYDISKYGGSPMIEVPISTLPILRLPLGLSYIMHFGLSLYKLFLLNTNSEIMNVYLHPYDLFISPDKRKAPFYFRFMYKERGRGFQVLRNLLLYLKEKFSPTYICAQEILNHNELVSWGGVEPPVSTM